MKKLVCCVLMLLLLTAPALAGDIAWDGASAYRLQDGELWALTDDLLRAECMCNGLTDAEAVCWHGGRFWFAVRTQEGVCIGRWDGALTALFQVPTNRTALDIAVAGDQVFVLWQYADGEQAAERMSGCGPIVAYDMDGRIVMETIGYAIAPSQKGVLIAEPAGSLSGTDTCVREWITADGNSVIRLERSGITAVCEIAGGLAYINGSGLHLWDESTGEEYTANIAVDERTTMNSCGDQLLLGSRDGGALRRVSTEEQSGRTTLTLVNCQWLNDQRMQAAIEQLQANHPEVDVQFRDMPEDGLRAALMAGETGLDILLVDNFLAPGYVEAGVQEDLREHASISGALEQWMDVRAAVTWNSVLFGVPWSVAVDAMSVNESLMEYLPQGLLPDSLTWRQLLEAGAHFNGDTDGDGRQDIWLWRDSLRFPAWRDQYIAGFANLREVRFDTEEFRTLLALYRQCVNNGALADLFSDISPEQAILCMGEMSNPDTIVRLPLPALDCGSATTNTAYAFGVNAASPVKTLAIELLANYAGVEAQRTYAYRRGEGDCYVGLLRDSSAYGLVGQLSESEKYALEANKRIAETAVMTWQNSEFNRYFGDQLERYIAGEIDEEEMIDSVQQKMQMILMG